MIMNKFTSAFVALMIAVAMAPITTKEAAANSFQCDHLGGTILPNNSNAFSARWWVKGATRVGPNKTYLMKFFIGYNQAEYQSASVNAGNFRTSYTWGQSFQYVPVLNGVTPREFCQYVHKHCSPTPQLRTRLGICY